MEQLVRRCNYNWQWSIELKIPRKVNQKWWKCDPSHEMGSGNPKLTRLDEKMWHNNKDGNEPGIV